VVHSMIPKHPWDYDKMMEMYRNGELSYEDEDENVLIEDLEDEIESENIETEEDNSDNFFSTSENSIDSSQNSTENDSHSEQGQIETLDSLDILLNNPSIQMYPQNPGQVECNAVQNLAEVFDNMYQQPRTSDRLAAKPRRDYRGAHNRGRY